MASYFGTLKNHNHTSTVGDGGGLSALSVASGLTVSSGNFVASTGNITATAGDVSGVNVHATAGIVDETANADTAAEVPRLDQMLVWNLLGG